MTTTARRVTLHGYELSFLDAGAGPAMLFIHGLLGSHRSWRRLLGGISDGHRVLAPDLFGHGASAKPMGDYSLGSHAATLRDLLDRLGIERATLVGHSLGGGIAMQFSYLFPERVERLVLVSSGGLGRSISPLLRSATLPGAEWVLPLVASSWVRGPLETMGRGLTQIGWRPSSMVTEGWLGFTSLHDADSRRAFLATIRGIIDTGGQTVTAHDHLPMVAGIPTLIVWGAQDRIIPSTHAEAAHRAIPGSQLEMFERAGHFPHLDEPERFATLLSAFVERPVRPTSPGVPSPAR